MVLTLVFVGTSLLKEPTIQIFTMKFDGNTIILNVRTSDAIEFVKAKIQEKTSIRVDDFRLIHGGKQLEQGKTLACYNIKKESTLWMALLFLKGCCTRVFLNILDYLYVISWVTQVLILSYILCCINVCLL